MQFTEHTFDTGEIKVNYAEWPDNGKPLVALHGLTALWQSMMPLLALLTNNYHVYAPDLRGHGQSGHGDIGYTLNDYARDVNAFLQRQLNEPAILIGHSLGALTALASAAQTPDAVRAIILLDPPLYLHELGIAATPDAQRWFQFVYDTQAKAKSYDDVFASVRASMPGAPEDQINFQAHTMSQVDPGTVQVALADQLLDSFDMARALHNIKCPTLLIRGDWDHGAAIREEDAEFFHANLPTAQIVKIPDAAHGFPQEQPLVTLQHINEFLDTLS